MPQHKRGPWSQTEDQYLLHLVNVHGAHNWVRISSTIQSRSPKQCRERFHQNLKPNLNHEPITPEEGLLIEQMVAEMGKRWAEIARRLRGRSDNAVKNWWNGGMNRRRRSTQQRRTELEVRHQPPMPGQIVPSLPPPPTHHHSLPNGYTSHAMVPQQYYGQPMYQGQHMSVPTNAASYRHSALIETPLPSPSAFSQMSADGAPSLISDHSSTRSPHNGTSPIELPPLSGARNARRHSSNPMLRLGVPGAFAVPGDAHASSMHMKQAVAPPMLQEPFVPSQQQQHHHHQPQQQQFSQPTAFLPSQPRHPSPLQHNTHHPTSMPAPAPPGYQHQYQQQQYQPQQQRQYPTTPQLPSTPTPSVQLPSISNIAGSQSTSGIPIDPALIAGEGGASPKDKMSLSNLTL